ncbi:MAG: ABATE domain-containing protein [Vicinamibacterales bacterium]
MARRRVPAAPIPDQSVDADRALAFVNTLSGRPTPAPAERLVSYTALVEWAQAQRLLSSAAADRLEGLARKHPHQAALVLGRARDLREALHGVLAAVEADRPPPAEALETLGRSLAAAYAHGRLVPHEGRLQWTYEGADELDRVVWEIAHATGRLVLSPRLARVRACAAGDCGWWFLDDTKNRSRRWCDMKICGNREKLRRFRSKGA